MAKTKKPQPKAQHKGGLMTFVDEETGEVLELTNQEYMSRAHNVRLRRV
jgi:hypothetical protein